MTLDKTVNKSEIGAAIKQRRKEFSMTQEQLGVMLDISGQQVQRYESGADRLNVEKLQEIAQALSVPVCYFFRNCARNTAMQNECYELCCKFASIQSKDVRDGVISFLGHISQNENKKGVPALRFGHYLKQNPILLVDDDEQVLGIVKLFLECEGFRNIHLIKDSRLVMPFLNGNQISLILLDLMMPYVKGNELLPAIKNRSPDIPIIIMTALDDIELAEECKKFGASDFLVKPVDPDRLLTAIYKALISPCSR